MADGESDQMVDSLWHQRPGRLCQRYRPIVAHEVRTLNAKMIQYPKDVTDEGGDAVGLDPRRPVCRKLHVLFSSGRI